MTPEQTITAYDALVERALAIADDAPHWRYVAKPELAKLIIDGNTAKLSWPECAYSYGDSYLDTESLTFDASLLSMSDDELAAWKASELDKYNRKQEAQRVAAAHEQQAKELALLHTLKAKYGA